MRYICDSLNASYRAAALLLLVGGLWLGGAQHAQAHPAAQSPLLRVSLAASTSSAKAGDSFTYSIGVTNNTDGTRSITVRDAIDDQLTVQGASSSAGSCQTGGTVSCAFKLAPGESATISISVQVRADITAAGRILDQAVAEDDIGDSIGSNTVIIAVQPAAPPTAAPPTTAPAYPAPPTTAPEATSAPTSAPAATSAPTSAPDATGAPTSAATSAPNASSTPTRTPRPTRKRDDDDDDDDDETATPEATATVAATAVPPAEATPRRSLLPNAGFQDATPTSAPPALALAPVADVPTIVPAQENTGAVIAPTVAPARATPVVDVSTQTGELPNTANTAPSVGVGIVLLGVGLVLHATRRVRRADAALTQQRAVVERLAPFVQAAVQRQHATAQALDQTQRLLEPRGAEEERDPLRG